MKIRSQILKYMHLDRTYCLLTGRCSSSEVKLIFVVFTLVEGNEYCIHIGGIFKNFCPQRVCVAVSV